MDQDDNQKKPIFYYYIIGIIILILLNALLVPQIKSRNTVEVPYSKFVQELEDKNVENVVISDDQREIIFELKDGKNNVNFTTGNMSEDNLVARLEESGVDNYKTEIPTEASPLLAFLLTWIIPFIFIFGLGQILIRSMAKKSNQGVMSFGKSNAKIYVKSETGKSFKDVAGQDEAKESLNEIVDFLNNPTSYRKIGAKLPKGTLLVGPPGTGKTLMAQALAGEANVPFFSISGSEFVQMFVGMGATKVRDLFKQAKEKAPCIIFIDEIDAIGKKRDSSGFGGNDEREQTLNQLLNEMDGFEGNEGVVILAATNRPEILDPALTRPGRFDREIRVELPDLKGREAILKVHAKKVKTDGNIDFKNVALATAGSSGAQLANIINEGALRAVREGRNTVSERDLLESVEVVIAGHERKNAVISPREKKLIAYHEVGHALVAAKQSNSAPVTKITIIPRTSGALGYTMQVEEEERFLMTKEDLFNKIVTLTGGRCAEELIFDVKTTGASNDIEVSTKYARAMVTRFGMTDEFGMVAMETITNQYLGGDSSLSVSSGTADKIDELVKDIIQQAHDKAYNILKENEESLHKISEFLLEKETITGEEFMSILEEDKKELVEIE